MAKKSKPRKKIKASHKTKRPYRPRLNPKAQEMLQSAFQYYQTGQLGQAEGLCLQVQEIDPLNVNTYNLLALIARKVGRLDEAVNLFQKALKLSPSETAINYNLADTLRDKGDVSGAVVCYGRCIISDPRKTDAFINFAQLLKKCTPQLSSSQKPIFKQSLLASLSCKNIDPQDVWSAALSFLLTEEVVNAINCFLDNGNIETLLSDKTIRSLLEDQLFLLLLRKTVNRNMLMEEFLTKSRKLILLHVASNLQQKFPAKFIVDFVYSLAHQCFWNEYLFFESPEERETVDLLIKSIENITPAPHTKQPFLAALIGCYRPLSSQELPIDYDKLITNNKFNRLLTIQIQQPAEERKIISKIKQLSEVSNNTSQLVQQQYEENPYPRWIGGYRPKPVKFLQALAAEIFPNKFDNSLFILDKPEILFPGCGTGRHPVTLAHIYDGVKILAVDLSLSSLAYAKRKALESGVENINFLQSDILDLNRLNKKFDVIECIGVLHHMEEPAKGLQVLASLLKKGGVMKIGFYSAHARQHVSATRDFIKNHGFQSSLENIRESRKVIGGLPEDALEKKVQRSKDFYTTSSVRDLLFHVQEYCFTLPEISEVLAEAQLKMLGFAIDPSVKKRYLAKFKDDPTAVSLHNWDQFEKENPHTFAGMYQFWVQRVE